MTLYPEPLICAADVEGSFALAGGPLRFDRVRMLERGGVSRIIPASELPPDVHSALTSPRAPIAGLTLDKSRLMGILNTTPDSFSDGGKYTATETAIAHARVLASQGADVIDIGGESTRPGAAFVPVEKEIARTVPVIEALRAENFGPLISIDTRKAEVGQAAMQAGAGLINDVSAMEFDPDMAAAMANSQAPVCLMHAQGEPETMQENPIYSNVVLDVFDVLKRAKDKAIAAGVQQSAILLDPGIGFGKTMDHNIALLKHLAIFHALGCPLLLGVSRKRFIGTITGVTEAADRVIGSVALALHGVSVGVQVLRVHDVEQTRQALAMQTALTQSEFSV